MRTYRFSAAVIGAVLGLAGVAATPVSAREVVRFEGYQPGTIVIRTSERRLYYVSGPGEAIRYPIAVGRAGMEWEGATSVARKEVDPVWAPPEIVLRDKPSLPRLVPPGPSNPLGPRAMLLSGGEYAIHGTNNRSSIGTKASYGCIRMYNENVVELYEKVSVGTPVIVQR